MTSTTPGPRPAPRTAYLPDFGVAMKRTPAARAGARAALLAWLDNNTTATLQALGILADLNRGDADRDERDPEWSAQLNQSAAEWDRMAASLRAVHHAASEAGVFEEAS